MMGKADIGLIGLGVMGKSLSRNIARNGFQISVYNRHLKGVEENVAVDFVTEYEEMKNSAGYDDISDFVQSLAVPRMVFLMVNAGHAVDSVIEKVLPFLDEGDVVIDGGNSHYKDTERRFQKLSERGIGYIGTGVSGGEMGALNGPSIMPGGSESAFKLVENILTTIAAKDKENKSCCSFVGSGGAGHFVKMVHNGIEYAEMQLIAEMYGIFRFGMKKSLTEISKIFAEWNRSECKSYLLGITVDILLEKDGDKHIINLILDKAGNKGTGSWTTIVACELGVAIPTITAALFARYQSSYYEERQKASELFQSTEYKVDLDLAALKQAYQLARLINHHQGFHLISRGSEQFDWHVDLENLSHIWTSGCIIRSDLMEHISEGFESGVPLLMHAHHSAVLNKGHEVLSTVLSEVVKTSLSVPCLSSALSYLNAFKEKRSLANIIQAQRDYFGAHTYERVDAPAGQKFHTQWE